MGKIRDNISKSILFYRTKAKMTQRQLAELVGVKHNSVATWEAGGSSPDAEIIFKLSDIFGVSVSDIYGQETGHTKTPPTDVEGGPIAITNFTSQEIPALLVHSWNRLNKEGQRKVADYASDLASSEQYVNKDITKSDSVG